MIKLLLSVLSVLQLFALNVREGMHFPKQLSKKEEMEYIEQMQKGDLQAKNKLIEHNLRLVSHIVKKYYSKTKDNEELISVGTVGLVKGVNSFKAEKNTKLSTYLAKCIQNEILMFFRSQKKSAQDVYFNDPIESDANGTALTLCDIVFGEDTIIEDVDTSINLQKLKTYLSEMSDEREKQIIISRYGLFNNQQLTQLEIARKLGISRSYVSRIEKKVIEDLRKKFGINPQDIEE